MGRSTTDVAFTPAVKAQQDRWGSRRGYAALESRGGWPSGIDVDLADFIESRDSFFLATASADGQPYMQHRGGAPGFLRVIGPRTLGFADYRGNKQYISVGNLTENPRAMIFIIDYVGRQRLKLWGQARVVEEPAEVARLLRPGDPKADRAIVFEVEAWDANCPQHIPGMVPSQPATSSPPASISANCRKSVTASSPTATKGCCSDDAPRPRSRATPTV